ncbi:MAG: hypothetical protein ABIH00_05100 [Armatimonadota bacterium]
MNCKDFFNKYPVFTLDEFRLVFKKYKPVSVYDNLKYYLKKDKICSAKRGLYYVIPEGSFASVFQPNKILLASRQSKDAVIAFHSALEVMGYGHSFFHRFFYYSSFRRRKFSFRENEFVCVKIPENLKKKKAEAFGVEEEYYQNLPIKFTNRERTFVDCLDKPQFGGGIEEVYRCIEKYPYLNFEEVLKYLDALGKSKLYAKVGFFLEQHREQFYVEEDLLKKLRKNKPTSIVYFDSQRKSGKLIENWNLVVPEIIIEKGWEEF